MRPARPGSPQDRQHVRHEVRLSADIETPSGPNMTAITRDLSVGGAALDCEAPLTEGESIKLSLFLVYEGIEDERTPPLVIGARVQWAAEGDNGTHSAGVKFEQITDPQREWLARVLAVTGG
jgi:c-di-GMP-binding flagellar brake protein YcgR